MPYLTTIAEFEALTGANALTPAEVKLIAACREGEACVLGDGTLPAANSSDRKIRADLLRILITGGREACGLHPSGVCSKARKLSQCYTY